MDCIGCEKEEVLNRVIVNQVSSEELGLYCEECESEKFGSLLDEPSWHQDHGCAFCDNPGTYKLPEADCIIKNDDGTIQYIEYLLFDDDVAMCESHLRELVADEKVVEELMPKEDKASTTLKV